MSIDQMHYEITSVYPGPKWRERVRSMHDNQVIAIYKTFQQKGKFEGRRDPFTGKNMGKEIPAPPPSPYHQMTIFEYLKGETS